MPRACNVAIVILKGFEFPGEFGVEFCLKDLEDLVEAPLQEVHALTQLVSGLVILTDKDLLDEAVDLPSSMLQLAGPVRLALGVQALQNLVKLQSQKFF